MKKKIVKIIVIILLSITFCIIINKLYNKSLKSKINDVSWLRKNVSITKNYMLGDNILSVNKLSSIDIYSDNYRKIIDEKISELTSKKYDFSSPLLIYNPYGTNSSGINIYFNTEEESYITYKIKVNNSDINDYTNTPINDNNEINEEDKVKEKENKEEEKEDKKQEKENEKEEKENKKEEKLKEVVKEKENNKNKGKKKLKKE